MSYICLNVLGQKLELYDAATRTRYIRLQRRGVPVYPDECFLDYRLTRAYQLTLIHCGEATTHTLPRQASFRLSHDLNNDMFHRQCGHMLFATLRTDANDWYSPDKDDTNVVI